MRPVPTLALCAAVLGALRGVAVAAPTISDPALSPSGWSNSPTTLVGWTQNDFGPGGLPGPADVQINEDASGGSGGQWVTLGSLPGPLFSGSNGIPALNVGDLEGQHRVRVVIDGASNSPFELGTLRLDRTPPLALNPELSPAGGEISAAWTQSDPLSGTDPAAPVVVEVNAAPDGGASGEWVPFRDQPSAGDGRRVARTNLAGLADGPHLVRVRSRDVAGNAGARVLGTVVADSTPPRVEILETPAARRPVPNHPVPFSISVTFRVTDPAPGSGVGAAPGDVSAAGAGGPLKAIGLGPQADDPSIGSVGVVLPGPGLHVFRLLVRDRAGNVGESGPVVGYVTPPEDVPALGLPSPRFQPERQYRPGPGARAAFGAARRLHARRGLTVDARLLVARNGTLWKRVLRRSAGRFQGYATLRGRIYLGPAATRALEELRRARLRPRIRRSRAELDSFITGLAVLLHETLHASGPQELDDVRAARSGRVFEEGFTEAVTVDLLRPYVAALRLPPPLRGRMLAAARRYRPAYPESVAWARARSAEATGSPAGSRPARALRIRVADRWGADRWTRLAAATGRDEASLRAEAARITDVDTALR